MRRTFVLILSAGLALGVVVAYLAQTVLVRSFRDIETAQMTTHVEQILRAFDSDLGQLAVSAREVAERDDTLRFVATGDRRYTQSNLQLESLRSMNVDVALISDAQGRDLYSVAVMNDAAVSPAPQELLAILRPLGANADGLQGLQPRQRLVRAGSDLYAFTTLAIANSNLTARVDATLVFARKIEMAEIQRLAATTRLSVEYISLGQVTTSAALPAPVVAWLNSGHGENAHLAHPVSDTQLIGYGLLTDMNGAGVAVLLTTHDRNVYTTGRLHTWYLAGTIIALIMVFAVAVLFLLMHLQRSWKARGEHEQRYRSVIEKLNESLVLADPRTGEIVEANAALFASLGIKPEEISRLDLTDLFVDQDALRAAIAAGAAGGSGFCECRMRRVDGRMIDAEVTTTAILHHGRQLTCLLARDVTLGKQVEIQRQEHEKSLAHLASHDVLTGLPNRLHLQSQLPAMIEDAAARHMVLALFYIDVDQFKNINDTRGHGAGDELLKITARRLSDCVGSRDLVVRMGGDEFVILANDLESAQAAAQIALRVVNALHEPLQIGGSVFTVTVSVGIGLFPDHGLDMDALLKHADIALYEAKRAGRDCFKFFADDMNVGLNERLAMEQALRHAIGTPQLYLEYQPIVDLRTGSLSSFEALLRWRHPELGLVPTSQFVAVAEDCGLITALGDFVLRASCAQLSQWRTAGLALCPVAVNVSPRQFERDTLIQTVVDATTRFGIDPRLLHLEVTESAIMTNAESNMTTLRALRDLGCEISVDDFGTGYSSLSYLKHLPLDKIKIDRAFVRDMITDPNDAAIVSAIISMATSLRLQTVAEGIENSQQLAMVRGLGCEFGQGFHVSYPLSASGCVAVLEAAAESGRPKESVRIRAARA